MSILEFARRHGLKIVFPDVITAVVYRVNPATPSAESWFMHRIVCTGKTDYHLGLAIFHAVAKFVSEANVQDPPLGGYHVFDPYLHPWQGL